MEIRRCRAEIAPADLLPTERAIGMMNLRKTARASTAEGLKRIERRHDLSQL
jgi:hypothetical protein